ncbi:MAG: hypothetical protein LQ351_005160 [Letrouitia transgressa]|nr:MAG: hypothetical protein LQ351_005160 [Letrouitia transgressa]
MAAGWMLGSAGGDRGRSQQNKDHTSAISQFISEFKIHGAGNLHGDGMAIWLTKERATTGVVFGSTDHFNGLGVFIDTYKNQRPGIVFPYVMAMMGNGTVSYDKEHDGKDNEIAGCSARGLRTASVPTKIRLTYFQETSLKVDLHYKSEDEWTECFETGPLTLPSVAYLGFSAETGELHDNHDVISVDTKNKYYTRDYKQQQSAQEANRSRGKAFHQEKERGSWTWFFLKLVMLGIVVVGGYVGWTMYRASQRSSRF